MVVSGEQRVVSSEALRAEFEDGDGGVGSARWVGVRAEG